MYVVYSRNCCWLLRDEHYTCDKLLYHSLASPVYTTLTYLFITCLIVLRFLNFWTIRRYHHLTRSRIVSQVILVDQTQCNGKSHVAHPLKLHMFGTDDVLSESCATVPFQSAKSETPVWTELYLWIMDVNYFYKSRYFQFWIYFKVDFVFILVISCKSSYFPLYLFAVF